MSCLVLYKGGNGEVTQKKSRFIADVFPVHTAGEAARLIETVCKKHYDARHHCFAYTIGEKHETVRSSDDGEPSGTAGHPILDVLLGTGVHDALIVVTRYFGGTLLGTGGLVHAYSDAAREGLKNSIVTERYKGKKMCVLTDYQGAGKLQYLISTLGLAETETIYEENVSVLLLVPEDKICIFINEVTEISAGKAKITELDDIYYGMVDGKIVVFE